MFVDTLVGAYLYDKFKGLSKKVKYSDMQSYRDEEGNMVGSKGGKWDGSQPEHIQMVDSTAIHTATYNKKTKNLAIQFRNEDGSASKKYIFPNVPESVVKGLLGASSKGRYYWKHIKPYSINA